MTPRGRPVSETRDRVGRGLATLAVILLVFMAWGQNQDRHAAQERAARNEQARAVLQAQIEQLGEVPADQHIDDDNNGNGADVVVIPGPQGERGLRGPAGKTGASGPPGPAGGDGQDGAAGPRGPPGADGAAGSDGSDGARGEPGSDGGPGPAGADGATGPPGPPGPPGRDGADGQDGAPGADGQSPESLRFPILGGMWTCTDPDGDGHYDCEPEAP